MAALNKRWVGTTGTWTTITNWAPISLRNTTYRWLLSGSGTTNYYLDLAGGGNPGISTPGSTSGAITGNDLAFTSGAAGSLTASQFGYGDADALGYSTIYVRLADGTDPDSKTLDYVKLYQVPVATDHVRIPAGAGAITGTDQSAVAIGDFIVEEGYTGAIGSATVPLYLDPDKFEFAGTGTSYISITTAAIAADVVNAGTGQNGTAGLYLMGSAISTLTVSKGTVGVALVFGQAATVTTARVNGQAAQLILGKNAGLTTLYVIDGKATQRCSSTTTSIYKGTLTTEEAGTITTLNANGGTSILNSTGTITTLVLNSPNASVDMLQSAEARVVTDLTMNSFASFAVDTTVVTFTNRPTWQAGPVKWSRQAA